MEVTEAIKAPSTGGSEQVKNATPKKDATVIPSMLSTKSNLAQRGTRETEKKSFMGEVIKC